MAKKLTIFIIALVLILGIYYFYSISMPASAQKSAPVVFKIDEGQGVNTIADNLVAGGLIKNKLIFKVYLVLTGAKSRLLAGEHQLSASMNMMAITKELSSAVNIPKEKNITIIEGWGINEIGAYLEKQNLVKKANFLSAVKIGKWRGQYDFLADVKIQDVEGFLFPDTYRVYSSASADEIIKKMLDNFDKKLTSQMRADIKAQKKTIIEVITLASIVEREGRSEVDKKMIADVFWKRLDIGMGLQSDATVNYITGKGTTRPSVADTQIDSPYNTYKYRGLPPGPISSPGLVAIKAVIYPEKNDYLFFLTDKSGKAFFAKTYEEHQNNIEKYLE